MYKYIYNYILCLIATWYYSHYPHCIPNNWYYSGNILCLFQVRIHFHFLLYAVWSLMWARKKLKNAPSYRKKGNAVCHGNIDCLLNIYKVCIHMNSMKLGICNYVVIFCNCIYCKYVSFKNDDIHWYSDNIYCYNKNI
jgi:hypothetical protein